MLKIKVIIHDGIVSDVLSNAPADVEIIDIDEEYEDYDALCNYEKEIFLDRALKSISFTVADFKSSDI